MGMNEEITKRLIDDSWDRNIANKVTSKVYKKISQIRFAYSIVFMLVGFITLFIIDYENFVILSDEYYQLYSFLIGEDLSFLVLVE